MPSTGTIIGFVGSQLSGLGYLFVEVEEVVQPIMCDNPTTVRALDDCFGDVIRGMFLSNDSMKGKRIKFETDRMGILDWFAPVGEESQC